MELGFNCEPMKTNLKVIMFKKGMRPVHPGEVLLEDYILPLGMECPVETVHLLRSRKNAERLLTALRRARTKSVEPTTLADLQRRMELDA
jgi:plasmid maintenance system antidote protein VapI